MGNRTRQFMILLSGVTVAGSMSGCTTNEPSPVPVDLDATDLLSWSESVLGDHDGMSYASRHDGSGETSGSFLDVDPGWYELTMACVGGNGMTLSLGADGNAVGNGTTECNSFAVTSHIQVMDQTDELKVSVTNSGEQMLWAISLVAAPEPSVHLDGTK